MDVAVGWGATGTGGRSIEKVAGWGKSTVAVSPVNTGYSVPVWLPGATARVAEVISAGTVKKYEPSRSPLVVDPMWVALRVWPPGRFKVRSEAVTAEKPPTKWEPLG